MWNIPEDVVPETQQINGLLDTLRIRAQTIVVCLKTQNLSSYQELVVNRNQQSQTRRPSFITNDAMISHHHEPINNTPTIPLPIKKDFNIKNVHFKMEENQERNHHHHILRQLQMLLLLYPHRVRHLLPLLLILLIFLPTFHYQLQCHL